MFVGGLDIGTTGCKIAVFNNEAEVCKTYYAEYDSLHKNGLHEISFDAVKAGVFKIIKTAAAEYRLSAIGVTGFGETFAMLDKDDNVLAPSMLYTDPRGDEQCRRLCKSIDEDKLIEITGVKPHQMYSISKIMWQKDNNPELFGKCRRILLSEDYIVYTLTGKAQIDYSLAARTAAFDIKKKCWCTEILSAAGVSINFLSNPVETGTVAGNITPQIKNLLGIEYDITIVNGCHDQVAAMIGSGVLKPYQAMDGTGTVECIPIILEDVPQNKDFYSAGYSVVPFIGGKYACYALSFTGGATLKWFRDNFAKELESQFKKENKNIYSFFDSQVSEKPTGILVLPHFAGAATPYMNSGAKAAIIGLTLETGREDLYKSLMEGTSFEMRLNFDCLNQYSGSDITEIRATGGGASSNVWLQIKADVLNKKIVALASEQSGAAGTAALCGVACDVYKSLNSAIDKMSGVRKTFVPNTQNTAEYELLYQKYKGIYKAVNSL